MASQKHLNFHPKHGTVEVKQGFCWPAFFFGSLWALARRVYLLFLGMLALDFTLWFVTGYGQAHGSFGLLLLGLVGNLAYAVARGKYGNRWVQSFLVSRGYVLRNGLVGT